MKKVYCDISATTPINTDVAKLMFDIQKNIFGNPSSVHKYGQEAHATIEKARIQVASALGCHQEEIIFTGCGSESNNIAIKGAIISKSHIISSSYEHPSVINVLKSLEEKGNSITFIKPNTAGQINPDSIKQKITKKTKLISIMFANNELGSINNISKIAKIAKSKGIILHVDAVQCIGKIPINLSELDIDLMSLSAHKFYGPKGIGALFIRKGIDLNPILDGGGQEMNLRPGTENIAGVAGLGLAIKKTCESIDKNIKHIQKLENRFIEQLNKYNIDYILHIEDRLPGVLAIGFPGIDGQSLLIALDLKGIAISFGSACSSGTTKASKILLDVGINEELAKSTLRISFGKIHNYDDIDYVAIELSNIINRINK